ncbi:MAG: FkbM family methyltransferase [Candidatus Lokiarchaeia archaeon]
MKWKNSRFYFQLFFRLLQATFKSKDIRRDFERFPNKELNSRLSEGRSINKLLQYREIINKIKSIKGSFKKLNKFADVFNMFDDNYSKYIFIELMSAFILGFHKVKLLLNNDTYWRVKAKVKNMIKGKKFITADGWILNFYDLNKIKIPLLLYNTSLGILNTFITEQYCYKHEKMIMAEESDIVIDAGGCWGDTSLYFANKVKDSGYVYSFEFIPSNINIMKKNLNLNPYLKNIIQIIEKPLWKISDCEIYYVDKGPSSHVSSTFLSSFSGNVKTITLDDFVEKNHISKIDFIKMDIEGSEYDVLIGAKETISKFKPKLAISLYHNIDHFYKIPKFIDSLNLNYRFYLDHFTTHSEETILFAFSK